MSLLGVAGLVLSRSRSGSNSFDEQAQHVFELAILEGTGCQHVAEGLGMSAEQEQCHNAGILILADDSLSLAQNQYLSYQCNERAVAGFDGRGRFVCRPEEGP